MDSLYEKMYENEFRLSKILFEKINISENRIDANDYNHIKDIFKNKELVNNVYKIILEITNQQEKISLLILADFLFSITSYSLSDPANLIYKTTRDDYLNKIRIRASINTIFEYDFYKYIELHQKLLVGLRANEVLKKSTIRKMNDEWSTLLYFKLNIDKEINHQIHIGYCEKRFFVTKINNVYYTTGSFRNIWILKRKRKEMEEVWIRYEAVRKANKIGFILSEQLYQINKKHLDKKEYEMIKKLRCASIDDYFKIIKKITEDDKYSTKLLYQKDFVYEDAMRLKKDIQSEYREILSEFQNVTTFKILKKKIFNTLIYLPHFLDNRGRQYSATLISPTFYKIFRYLYEFGEKKRKFWKLENSRYYKELMNYKNCVEEFSLSGENIYIAIILFLEVGKFFVKNLEGYMVKTEDMVKCGVDGYKKRKEIEFPDIMYLEKIYNELDRVINNLEININTILFKDATSSGLQNYGILLGYKKEKLKFINLDGKDWCDTYMYIINKFLETNENRLRKRKYWKSTIMTIPYNSVWYSCYTKFLEKIRKDNLDLEIKKEELKLIHRNFYDKVKNELKKELYKNSDGRLMAFKYNKWIPFQKKEYKINYKKERDKYVNITYLVNPDDKATSSALEANNMHYLDAKLVSFVIKKFDVLTVHDCFGIRLCELHLVMDRINKYYSKATGEDTYSIHIII